MRTWLVALAALTACSALSPLEQLPSNVLDSIARALLFVTSTESDAADVVRFAHADRTASEDIYRMLHVSRTLSDAAQRAIDRYPSFVSAAGFEAWHRRGLEQGSQTFARCHALTLPSIYDQARVTSVFDAAIAVLPSLLNLRRIDIERMPEDRWDAVVTAIGGRAGLLSINCSTGQFDNGTAEAGEDEDRPWAWAVAEATIYDFAKLLSGSAATMDSVGLSWFKVAGAETAMSALPQMTALVSLSIWAMGDAVPLTLGIMARAPRLRSLWLTSFSTSASEMTLNDAIVIIKASAGRLRALRLDLSNVPQPPEDVLRSQLAASIVEHAPDLEVLGLCGVDLLPLDNLVGVAPLRVLVLDLSTGELADFGELDDRTDEGVDQLAHRGTFVKLKTLLSSASTPREIAHTSDYVGVADDKPFDAFARALAVRQRPVESR